MANKPAVPRVSTASSPSTISGMDGQQMHNEILLGLPRKECDVLFPDLEYVEMRTHDALHEAGRPITHGYFVNDGLASVLNVMKDGKSVEVGLAGKEVEKAQQTLPGASPAGFHCASAARPCR